MILNKPYQISFQDITILICLLGLVFLKFPFFADDPGLGWHLKTGEFVSLYKQIPASDPFTFSTFGKPWLVDQWFADWILYQFLNIGDWPLLYLFTALVIIYTFLYLPFRRLVSESNSRYLFASLLVLFSFYLSQIHFLIRPVVFSFLSFQIILGVFEVIAKKQFASKFDFLKVALIVIFWVNTHPSFLLVWILFLCLLIDRCWGEKNGLRLSFSFYLKLFCLILVSTLLNPKPLELYSSMLSLSVGQAGNPIFEEWQAPKWPMVVVILLPILLIVSTFFWGQRRLIAKNLWLVLFTIILGLMAIKAVRFVPYYAMAIVPVIYLLLPSVFLPKDNQRRPYSITWEIIVTAWTRLNQREQGRSAGSIGLLIAFSLLLASFFFQRIPGYQGDLGPSKEVFPYAAVSSILQKSASQSEVRVLNDINFGGFLIGWGGNKIRAFVDDRASLHGIERYQEMSAYLTPQKIKKYALQYGADYLLLEYNQRNQTLIDYFKLYQKDSIVLLTQQAILIETKLLGDFSKDV